MDNTFETDLSLPPGELRALSGRADGPTVRHLLLTLAGLGAALLLTFLSGSPALRATGVLLSAIGIGGTFPAFHEALHRTGLRTRLGNDAAAWITGFFQIASPTGYRAFHYAHHRHTHAPDDPEIAIDPERMARWPVRRAETLVILSGQPILLAKAAALIATTLLPASLVLRMMPFLAPNEARRVRFESAVVLVAHAGIIAAVGPTWILILVLGHAVMGPLLAAEHTGLSMEGPVVARTRSLRAHPWLAWYWWNMNLHAEHHGWPCVPWWQLPRITRHLGDRLPHRVTYTDAWCEAWREGSPPP